MPSPELDLDLLASSIATVLGRRAEGMEVNEARRALEAMGLSGEQADMVIGRGLSIDLFERSAAEPSKLRRTHTRS